MKESYRLIIFGLGLACLLVLVGTSLTLVTELFLILFLAILFGVFLTKSSAWIAGNTQINYGFSLAVVTLFLVLLCGIGIGVFGVQLDAQIAKVQQNADAGVERLRELAQRYPTLKEVLVSTPFVRDAFEGGGSDAESKEPTPKDKAERGGNAAPEAEDSEDGNDKSKPEPSGPAAAESGVVRSTAKQGMAVLSEVFKTTFGLLINSLLIFFVGLFLAVKPEEYRDGIVRLFPRPRRERARDIMNQIGGTLWQWLLGRFATMLITGVGAGLLLFFCGTPMAFTLGVITGLLTFIPNIGGFLALVLAVLFSLPLGGTVVASVIGGYLGLQLLESYLATPLIQQQQAALPPALLISCQAVLGVLLGFLGAAVASPLLAATKVVVEEAYIKDVLEQGSSSGEEANQVD